MKLKHLHKTKVYGIIRKIIFLLILFTCLGYVYNVTLRKGPYQKMADFFKQEEDFDVLFFGSSHTLNGIFPMDLWNNYGIVSYNVGNSNERMSTTYYNMLLALKETNPKLAVIDAFTIYTTEKINISKKELVHTSLDTYPISYTKYLAVKDLFDGKDLINNEIEYLFKFSMYHTRWNNLTENDFKKVIGREKGAESRIDVVTPDKVSKFDSIEVYNKEETVNMEYLRKIIKYCQDRGIDVLVTWIPHPATDEHIAVSKYTQTICDEFDVKYINFLGMDEVDYNIDCCDRNSHLNPSGARKITDYLGKYIKENYDIADQRQNEKYNFWYQDYSEYVDLKISNLNKNEQKLNNYLMLLYAEKDIKYEIKLRSNKEIRKESTLQRLLANLENNYQIDDEDFKGHKDKFIKITTYDNRNGSLIKTVWF